MRTNYRDFINCKLNTYSEIGEEKKAIIDKVVKLMALADGSTFEGERQTARDAATALMKKHNIAISKNPPKTDTFYQFKEIFEKRQLIADVLLRSVLCDFTDMKLYKYGQDVLYCGTYASLQAFQYMLQIVIEQRERALKAYKKTPDYKYASSPRKAVNSWKESFAVGVAEKCRQLKAATKAQLIEDGLVVIDEAAMVRNWMERNNNTGSQKHKTRVNPAGIEAGNAVQLNKGVGGAKTTQMIGC